MKQHRITKSLLDRLACRTSEYTVWDNALTGFGALGRQAAIRIVQTIAAYDDFGHANDPHEEHDFGCFKADGKTVFFKIDYFDNDLKYHSPGPSDPSVTKRVIAIMLAEEY